MSIWLSNRSVSVALRVAGGLRLVQHGASSLMNPAALRRAQTQVVRLIAVVAGH